MKKYFAWAGLFIALYVFFVVRLIPISQLTGWLPPQAYLHNPHGSVWLGSAEQAVINQQNIDEVSWSFNLFSLLRFDPSFHLNLGNSFSRGLRGEFDVAGLSGQLSITSGFVTLDANEILKKLPMMVEVQGRGEVTLAFDELTLGQPVCHVAAGQITWSKASIVAFEQQIPLGDLVADLGCEEGKLVVTVAKDNDLGLEFQLVVQQGNRYTGQGYLKPGAKFPKALEPVLDFLPSPDSQGRYKLKI